MEINDRTQEIQRRERRLSKGNRNQINLLIGWQSAVWARMVGG
jgi:hypothetical protein